MTDKLDKGGFRPARGYSWPPFEPGNLANLRHGAESPRKIAGEIERLEPELAEQIADVGYLTDPSYVSALAAWARAEARIRLLERWFGEKGLLQEDGTPRPGVDLLLRCESQASRLRSRLGLDPVSRAALQKDLSETGRNAADLASALAEGRKLRLAAEARFAAPDDLDAS